MECLVTKLKGTVDDTSLLKMGEMRLKKSRVSSWNDRAQSFVIAFNEPVTLSIIGDGYFTDKEGTANKGKDLSISAGSSVDVYVSNGDFEISIPNKYALSRFNFNSGESDDTLDAEMNKSKSFDVASLNYSHALAYLSLYSTGAYGDARGWNFPMLENVYLGNSDIVLNTKALGTFKLVKEVNAGKLNIDGDISELSGLTAIQILNLSETDINGDVASLSDLDKLQVLMLNNCASVYGNLSSFVKLTKLTRLSISYTGVTGSIDSLSALADLSSLSVAGLNISGDISKLPNKIAFISGARNTGVGFTWETTRSSSAYIIALEQVNLGSYVDAMLNNQANCRVGYNGHESEPWYKIISVTGTRTTASDDAISTLQEKGFTVTVPVATDVSSISLMLVNSLDSSNYGIAYKDTELIVEPVDLTKMQIYPTNGVTVKKFDTIEEAKAFVSSNGLVKAESK